MQVNLEQNSKAFIVLNPVAGISEAEAVREAIQSALQNHNIAFDVHETTGGENIKKLVRQAIQQGYKLFVAAGGDGTLSAVADGLVDTELPLVIVPTGTWNALARALSIPLQADQAINLLFGEHTVRSIDTIKVGERFYTLNVSAGIGSIAMGASKREEKRKLGKLHDFWNALVQIMGFRTFRYEITIDGKSTRFRASELMIANSGILGLKAVKIDPDIRMDDGILNVCRIFAVNLVDYLKLGVSFVIGKQRENSNVVCLEALKEVEIRSTAKLPVQADGEIIGQLPIKVKLHPKSLCIVTPRDAEA
jgi:YegS/Rv2252/BmrU family lipid kinase